MNEFDYKTRHLSNCEKQYLKLLIDPFSTPVIRAPSENPRACKLISITTEGSYRRSAVASEYLTVEYQPDSAIFQQSSSATFYPLTIREWTDMDTNTTVRYFQSNTSLLIKDLDSHRCEFRIIASALRVSIDSQLGQTGGQIIPTYCVNNNNNYDNIYLPPDQDVYYANDFVVATVATQATGTPYSSGVYYEHQTKYPGINCDHHTSFFVPSDSERFETYWNANGTATTSGFAYGADYILAAATRSPTVSINNTTYYINVSAVTVYEVCSNRKTYNTYGESKPYPNYTFNSMSKILNLLQFPSCYKGGLKNFNLSSNVSKYNIEENENYNCSRVIEGEGKNN